MALCYVISNSWSGTCYHNDMFKLKESHTNKNWYFAFQIMNPHACDEDYCLYHIAAFTKSLWFIGPELFKPKTVHKPGWKYPTKIQRDYGFSVDREALHIRYGIQPGEWSSKDPKNSDHSKCYFIPWNAQRRISYKFFMPDNRFWMAANDKPNGAINFDLIQTAEKSVPKIKFSFNDYDGRPIIATCHIEETIYRRGTGFFKWLGYIFPKTVYKRLAIEFDNETGRQSGSWKGGITGTSTEMKPSETALSAFQRYGTSDDYEKYYGVVNRGFTNIKEIK